MGLAISIKAHIIVTVGNGENEVSNSAIISIHPECGGPAGI